MQISLAPIRSITCRIVSAGQGDPAMMPVRRLDRSQLSKLGSFSIEMNIVGTP